MKNKLNILFLQTDFPFPPTGGGRSRSYYLLKELSRGNNITLLSFALPSTKLSDIDEMRQYCSEVVTVPFNGAHSMVRFLRSQLSSTPYKVLQYSSPLFRDQIQSIASRKKFDLVFSEHPNLAQYIPKEAPCVIPQNIEMMAGILKRTAEMGSFVMKMYARSQWRKVWKYEIDLFKRFGVFVSVSDEEEQMVASLIPNIKTRCIPNGIDAEYFSTLPELEKGDGVTIVFTGVFSYYPNEQAVLHFAKEIFPIIRTRIPNVRFMIVGREPGMKVKKLEKDPSIIVTGFVNDIRPFLQKASVVVAPLLIGGGTRLKILEAMSMSKPVISTKIGCEGLSVRHNENIFIADSAKDFAASVVEILSNPDTGEKIGKNARKLIEQNYRWEVIGKKLDDFVHEIVEGKNRARVQGETL